MSYRVYVSSMTTADSCSSPPRPNRRFEAWRAHGLLGTHRRGGVQRRRYPYLREEALSHRHAVFDVLLRGRKLIRPLTESACELHRRIRRCLPFQTPVGLGSTCWLAVSRAHPRGAVPGVPTAAAVVIEFIAKWVALFLPLGRCALCCRCKKKAYFSGKMLAKMGRIALIAEEMGRPEDARMVAARLAEASQVGSLCRSHPRWLGKLKRVVTRRGVRDNAEYIGHQDLRCI